MSSSPENPENSKPANIVWGAPAIARAINRTERQTYDMLEKGMLPGAKRWVSPRAQAVEASAPRRRPRGIWSLNLDIFRGASAA
jgi:hypothetical protein